jgi:hypothetical protein
MARPLCMPVLNRPKKNRPGFHHGRFSFALYPDYLAATVALRWGSFSLIRADLPLRSRR